MSIFQSVVKAFNSSTFLYAKRFVSSKFFKPHPRSYKRRLFEAAIKPDLPPEISKENERLARNDVYAFFPEEDNREYTEYDLAEVAMIREWIKDENYRFIGICQLLYVKEKPRWLAQNQFRLQGLEFKQFSQKSMKKLFENTAFRDIRTIFGDQTCVLFGKDINCLKNFIAHSAKYNWLVPLAITYDNRVLSIREAEQIARLESPEGLRAETVQIMDQAMYSFLNI